MTLLLWTLAIGVATAVACAICGAYLVLRREALVSEGLSHAVLPGIVLAFLVTGDRASPLLLVGAALAGLGMVLAVQAVERTGRVPGDASLGVVFSALFAAGIVLASTALDGTYFHAHTIVEGNLALAPLDRMVVGGVDLGPRALVTMGGCLVLLLGFLALLGKEMKVMVFDPGLARDLGLRPALVHRLWLSLVALTAVAAFDVAGTVLVVALMIAPAAAATLLVDGVGRTVLVSCVLGVSIAAGGVPLGFVLDVSPSAAMSACAGALFAGALFLSPGHGLLARRRRGARAQDELEARLVVARAARQPEGRGAAAETAALLGWSSSRHARAVARAQSLGWLDPGTQRLTAAGQAAFDADRGAV